MTSYQCSFPLILQTYFKNRRARERQKKKCQQLPGKIGSGLHSRPTYAKAGEVPLSATSTDSVCQSHMDVSCLPQFRPPTNSPHQESKFFFIDQPLEKGCFSKSHVIEEHQNEKCTKVSRNQDSYLMIGLAFLTFLPLLMCQLVMILCVRDPQAQVLLLYSDFQILPITQNPSSPCVRHHQL